MLGVSLEGLKYVAIGTLLGMLIVTLSLIFTGVSLYNASHTSGFVILIADAICVFVVVCPQSWLEKKKKR